MSSEIKKVCDLILEYYIDNSAGGALHIVLDDGNLEDRHIHWCLNNAIKENKDDRAKIIAEKLLTIGPIMRQRIYDDWWEFEDTNSVDFITEGAAE